MKLNSLPLSLGVIVALVLYILYLTQCKGPAPCPEIPEVRIDTQYIYSEPAVDTIYQPGDTVYRKVKATIPGKDSIVFVEVIKPVPATIDTQAIIEDFYSKIIQVDSMKTEGVTVHTIDTLYKNRIIGRYWSVVQTRVIPKPTVKRQFYFGGGFHTSLFLNKGLPTEAISAGHIDLGYINRKGQHLKIDLMRSGGRWHEGLSFYHTFGK